jgi:hypothetical protein
MSYLGVCVGGGLDFDDVLVQGDIQEEEGFIWDIRDVAAAEKISQLQSGLNHCNYFLKSYCAKEKIRY